MAKTITLSAGLTWPNVKNDFILRHDGLAIGRIRLDEGTWRWQVTVPMTMPLWTSGTADSLEESKRAFAAAWRIAWADAPTGPEEQATGEAIRASVCAATGGSSNACAMRPCACRAISQHASARGSVVRTRFFQTRMHGDRGRSLTPHDHLHFFNRCAVPSQQSRIAPKAREDLVA